MNKKAAVRVSSEDCKSRMQAVQDTISILGGKWKIRILTSLHFGPQHYMELQRRVNGIGTKMLSQELRDLEMNELIRRTVQDTRPVTVQYELTDYGKTLRSLITEMQNWGFKHRERIFRSGKKAIPIQPCEAPVNMAISA